MDDYNTIHRKITNIRTRRNFGQIIGEHAIAMCDLAKADKTNNKRGLMESWVNVYKLNTEWVNKVCYGENPDSEYCIMVRKMMDAYSTCLADYILDRKETKEWKERMSYIVDKETQFFNALGKGKQDAQKQWISYTGSIIKMTNAIHNKGLHSDLHYIEATSALRNGVCLGQWLDYSLSS